MASNVKKREHDKEAQMKSAFEKSLHLGDGVAEASSLLQHDAEVDMVACFFHWFGVSLCDYARLTGFLRAASAGTIKRDDLRNPARSENANKIVDDYVGTVHELRAVLAWRNKVGNYFSITEPHKGAKTQRPENVSSLNMPIILPVAFSDGRYYVGMHKRTKSHTSQANEAVGGAWSVTEVFENLIPRYWPDLSAPTR